MNTTEQQLPSSATPPTSSPTRNPHTSDHLANERTFLAWIRTSIAIIGLGFVVAKFSVWLRELANRFDQPIRLRNTGLSLPLGVGMMAAGGFFALVAVWRYRRVRKAIDLGESAADEVIMVVTTILVLVIAAVLITYMVATR